MFVRHGIAPETGRHREMWSHLAPEPAASERVFPLDGVRDSELVAALASIQSASLTISCVGALAQADVKLGGTCAFITLGELGRAVRHLSAYAAADVGLLFDRSGVDLLRFLDSRPVPDSDAAAMRAMLVANWRRLKPSVLSIRNNVAHHAPSTIEGHNHGIDSLSRVKFRDLMQLVVLAHYCAASLLEPADPAYAADLGAWYHTFDKSTAFGWALDVPELWPVFPSVQHIVGRLVRWPGSLGVLTLRAVADWADQRRAREHTQWHAAPDAAVILQAAHGTNGSAALSQLYAALIREEIGVGRGHFLAGPLTRAMARTRILQVLYASVVRLFEPGRINLVRAAEANWQILPLTARSLFSTYLWPLWRARASDLREFRNCGGYHFAASDSRSTASWLRLQQRLDPNTVHALLFMCHAFLSHSQVRRMGLKLMRPHPTVAPSLAFDPRHPVSVYDHLTGGRFSASPDFALILRHQPPEGSTRFPAITKAEAERMRGAVM